MPVSEKIILDDGSLHYVLARFDDGSMYFHREDGPAVEWASGGVLWYLWGSNLDFADWLNKTPISDEGKVMLKLKYG